MPASPTSWRRLLADRRWPLLMAVCALCVVLAYQRSTPFRLDLTSRLDATLLEGFYSAGPTPAGPVRWTAGRAALRVPNLWPGQPVRLTLALSAPRGDEPDPAKRDLPVTAAVAVNGHPLADLPMNAGPTEYELIVPAGVIGPSGNLFVTLQAPTFVPPADLRTLALLVAGVSATPTGRPPHLPPAEPLLSLTALTGLVYLWLRRLGIGKGRATSAAALVIGLGTAGLLTSRPFVTPASDRLLYLLSVACLTTELTVRLGRPTLELQPYRAIAALFLVAFAIRLALAHTPGDHDNFIAFKMMLENVTTHGIAAAYGIDPVIGAYPPIHHYLLALPGHLYRLFVSPEFDVASRRLNFIMKQPTILLDMLIAVTVLIYALRRTSPRRALLIGAAYAFNPGIIYTTSYNGQLGDPLYALFVTLAVAGLLAGQAASTGAATALAVLTKPQASAFLPFLLVGALRHLPAKERESYNHPRHASILSGTERSLRSEVEGCDPYAKRSFRILRLRPRKSAGSAQDAPRTLSRWLAAGAAVSLAVLTPFLLAGTVGQMIRTVSTTIGHGPRIVSNAFNIWWLWGWGNSWQIKDTGTLLGPVTYRTAGLALFFGLAYGLALWKLWKPRKTGEVALLAGFVGLAFFMLPTEIHENYLFPLFGLLALAAVHDRRAWLLDAILAVTWFFNLVTTDVTLMRPLTKAWPAVAAAQFPFQVGLAVINVAVLFVWGYWVWRMGRPERVSRTNATVQ